ncbi:MAG: LptF/LptG family permease [Phycisphaerales bacterium]|nr:LptF/LptG family permease [Phycisphaerales bacterium]
MTLIDRYIARQYITNILALLVILFGFVVTIDMALNLDRYWDQARTMAGVGASGLRIGLVTVMLVWDLWWPRLLQLFNYLCGLVLVGAMGFTVSQLVRHRELVAVLTSGQSLFRVARPIVLVAAAFTLLQLASQQWVIPRIAALLTRDPGEAGQRTLGAAAVPLTKDGQGRLLRAAEFDADKNTLRGVHVIITDARGLAVRRITADEAVWAGNAWNLVGGVSTSREPGPGAAPQPVSRLETSLDPLALKLERYKGMSQSLSWGQVGQLLASLGTGSQTPDLVRTHDRLQRVRYGRLGTAAANMLTLLIALSFFLTREPQGMVLRALKCAPVGIASLIGAVFGAAATVPGIPPQVSVFLPAMVLATVAVALLSRVRS